MNQHGVELFTLPNCLVITNPQLFYFAAEDDVSDEGGGWTGEADISQPQLSDGHVIMVYVFVDNMQTTILYITELQVNPHPLLVGRGGEEEWYTLDISSW